MLTRKTLLTLTLAEGTGTRHGAHESRLGSVVADLFPDVRFLIVGDQGALAHDGIRVGGSYREALERLAERIGLAGRVVFSGFRLDVAEILGELAVSVLPSVTGEGLPKTVLESMAAGVPVVGTDSGGTKEAIENGETGLLVPSKDAATLAQAIGSLLADPSLASRMAAAGRQRVAKRFSLNRMAQEMPGLYTRLLQRRQHATASQPRATAV